MNTRLLVVRVLIVGGLVLLAGGLLLGFLPRTAGGVSCGSAFKGNDKALVADFGRAIRADSVGARLDPDLSYAANCADVRSSARIPAVTLLVLGGAATLAGFAAAAQSGEPAKAQSPGARIADGD